MASFMSRWTSSCSRRAVGSHFARGVASRPARFEARASLVLAGAARSVALTALMVLAVWAVGMALPEPRSWWWSLANLLAAVGAGALVVFGGGAALRMPELRWAIGLSEKRSA